LSRGDIVHFALAALDLAYTVGQSSAERKDSLMRLTSFWHVDLSGFGYEYEGVLYCSALIQILRVSIDRVGRVEVI
jgi:hypothetical protein